MDKWEKYRIFVGKNADYYIPRFKKFEETQSVVSWNWAAFFFGLLWMLYRKMYLYSVIFTIALFLFGLLLSVFNLYNNLVMLGVQIWLWVGFGVFGNYVYYTHVEKKVKDIENRFPDPQVQAAILEKEGGVSWIAPIIFFLIIFILQILTVSQMR